MLRASAQWLHRRLIHGNSPCLQKRRESSAHYLHSSRTDQLRDHYSNAAPSDSRQHPLDHIPKSRRLRTPGDFHYGRPNGLTITFPRNAISNTISEKERILLSLATQFQALKNDIRKSFSFGDFELDEARFWECFDQVHEDIKKGIYDAYRYHLNDQRNVLIRDVIKSWKGRGVPLKTVLKKEVYKRAMTIVLDQKDTKSHYALADMRYPMEWYHRARSTKRAIHLHVGPTNSGKTHNALKRLRESTGPSLYAGPLRMLAQEIYQRLNAQGKPTWLLTGDDRQNPNTELKDTNEYTISCTVEMIPMNSVVYDVAVIDEIQMLANNERGAQWTAALLGVAAQEVHLCGEERAVDIVRQIVTSLGEELIIHRYERLTPLEVMKAPITSLSQLEKGDCIVAFSISKIHAIRRKVEMITGKRCAVVYGSLPSEVRAQQAKFFNDPDNDYDFLVASDAIGMGLNLAVRRMIFFDTMKQTRSGSSKPLTVSEVRQIGGRAGRYRISNQDTQTESVAIDIPKPHETETTLQGDLTSKESADRSSNEPVTDITDGVPLETTTPASLIPASTVGYVTALNEKHLDFVRRNMSSEPEPIKKAGLKPTTEVIERFYSYFPPGVPYSFILTQLWDISRVSSRYFIADVGDQLDIADAIEIVKDLKIKDRITMCFAPAGRREPMLLLLLQEMAHCVANQSGGNLLDLSALNIEVLDQPPTRNLLEKLEVLHKGLVLYCWMGFRFPGVFNDRVLAMQTKSMTEEAINTALATISLSDRDPFTRNRGFNSRRITANSADGAFKSKISSTHSSPHTLLLDKALTDSSFALSPARHSPLPREHRVSKLASSGFFPKKAPFNVLIRPVFPRQFSSSEQATTYTSGKYVRATHSGSNSINTATEDLSEPLNMRTRSFQSIRPHTLSVGESPTPKRSHNQLIKKFESLHDVKKVSRPVNSLNKPLNTKFETSVDSVGFKNKNANEIVGKATSGDGQTQIGQTRMNALKFDKNFPLDKSWNHPLENETKNLAFPAKGEVNEPELRDNLRIRKYELSHPKISFHYPFPSRRWSAEALNSIILDHIPRIKNIRRPEQENQHILHAISANDFDRDCEAGSNPDSSNQEDAVATKFTEDKIKLKTFARMSPPTTQSQFLSHSDHSALVSETGHEETSTTEYIHKTSLQLTNDEMDRLIELATKTGHSKPAAHQKPTILTETANSYSKLSEAELSALTRLRDNQS